MSHPHPPRGREACEALRRELAAYARALHRGFETPEAQFPLRDDIRRLRTHVGVCAPCARRSGAQLRDVEGHWALHKRGLPRGALEGFYEAVREQTPLGVAPGGAMSLAFLDAPRNLRIWRSAAVAAGLLLAVGIGFVASGRVGVLPRPGMERPLHDARPDLLIREDGAPSTSPYGPTNVVPVTFPARRGDVRFFVRPQPNAPARNEAEALPRWN